MLISDHQAQLSKISTRIPEIYTLFIYFISFSSGLSSVYEMWKMKIFDHKIPSEF
jgi:hypothetical protein